MVPKNAVAPTYMPTVAPAMLNGWAVFLYNDWTDCQLDQRIATILIAHSEVDTNCQLINNYRFAVCV